MSDAYQIILNHLGEIISFICGGAVGSVATLNFCNKTASKGGKIVDQSYAQAGGDNVGGNKTTINE